MTEKQKEEIYPIMAAAGLDTCDVLRDASGVEYIALVCKARAYTSKGDWKKNTKTALQDMVTTSQVALDRFNKAVD